jgi:hypothetical protein
VLRVEGWGLEGRVPGGLEEARSLLRPQMLTFGLLRRRWDPSDQTPLAHKSVRPAQLIYPLLPLRLWPATQTRLLISPMPLLPTSRLTLLPAQIPQGSMTRVIGDNANEAVAPGIAATTYGLGTVSTSAKLQSTNAELQSTNAKSQSRNAKSQSSNAITQPSNAEVESTNTKV